MKRIEKEKIVKEINEKFSQSSTIVVSDYKGLDVQQMSDLRRRIRAANAEMKVVKNTLLRSAAKETDAEALSDFFKEQTVVATTNADPVAFAKALVEFAKEFEKFNIKAGVLNGTLLDLAQLKKLATVPSREVLLSQLLSVFNAVPTSFVRVLSGVQVKLLNVLNAIKDTKEQ